MGSSQRTSKIVKVLLLGDGNVGKTTLRKTYMGETFKASYSMTVGADFSIKRIDGHIIQIYDLAGQPGFKLMRKNYYMGAQVAIVVFDVTKPATMDSTKKWIEELQMEKGKSIPLVIVGNKIDLRENENFSGISYETGKKFAENVNLEFDSIVFYKETSAKTGENVDEMFNEIIDYFMEKSTS